MTNDLARGLRSGRLAEEGSTSYICKMGAHWLRLIVGSAGGMSRMVRWPRKKTEPKQINADHQDLALAA